MASPGTVDREVAVGPRTQRVHHAWVSMAVFLA